jgi:hypothetical protein
VLNLSAIGGTSENSSRLTPAFTPEIFMRTILAAAAVCTLFASAAFAQTSASQTSPQNPAMKGMHDNNSSSPVAGANSFTMSQAKAQIQAKGYAHVMGLKKGSDGVWRGTARKDGQSGPVSVDYQGNVN